MTLTQYNSLSNQFSGNNKTLNRFNGFLLLFFASAVVFAQSDNLANGITKLPDSYRTPLSDMVYDDNNQWRAEPEEEYPWREGEEEPAIKPRIKTEFFPKYDYETEEDPTTRSLFQNEYELERPRTNIFKYTF